MSFVLRFVARLIARRVYLFLRQAALRVALHMLRVPRALEGVKILVFAVFPFNWSNAWGSEPADRTYGTLASALDEWKPTRYLVTLGMSPFQLWTRRASIREVLARVKATPILLLANARDLWSFVRPDYLIRLIRAAAAVRDLVPCWYRHFNVAPMVRQELLCSLSGSELALNMLWVRCLHRLCDAYAVDLLVHWCEFQPIERAIAYGVTRSSTERDVTTAAFQHSTASPMFLSYHFAPGELAEYVSDHTSPHTMPLPSVIVTTGTYVRDTLQANGLPPDRVRACGAVRYGSLLEQRRRNPSKELARRAVGLSLSERVVVLATTSQHRSNLTMTRCLGEALAANAEPVTVLIKCHPLLPRTVEAEIAESLTRSSRAIKAVTFENEIPLHRMLAAADVLVTNSSATGVEAMALGVMPVFFHNPYLYDLSVLYSLQQSILLATNAHELRVALDDVFAAHSAVLDHKRGRWGADLTTLFYRLDAGAEARFVEFLRANSSMCRFVNSKIA